MRRKETTMTIEEAYQAAKQNDKIMTEFSIILNEGLWGVELPEYDRVVVLNPHYAENIKKILYKAIDEHGWSCIIYGIDECERVDNE